MKRLHSHFGFGLGAVLFAATALLVSTAPAQAAPPTQAPSITAKPNNPNTTDAVAVFEYTKGAGEAATITGFQCRQYRTANPPANPNLGWTSCVSSIGSESGTRSYPNLTNESQTFEVRAVSSTSETGPLTTYVWTQNLPVPSQAPVLTDQPDDPMRDFPTRFAYEPGAGEDQIVDRFECRVDDEAWFNCTTDHERILRSTQNGERTFEVRAGNQIGYGPSISFTWTADVPNPEPSVRVGDRSVTRLDGAQTEDYFGGVTYSEGASAAGITGLGDVNDDGIDDFAAATAGLVENYGVYVVFGDRTGLGVRDVNALGPDEGFKITVGTDFGYVRSYRSIGDQNGDGVRDILVAAGNDINSFDPLVFVVYGGVDPADLPACPNAAAVRCLDLNSITDDQGYTLTSSPPLQFVSGSQIGVAGDFDGDGIEDIAVGNGGSDAWVVNGGERTGVTDVNTLPADELFKAHHSNAGGFGFAIGLDGVGDLNSDGKDDIYVNAPSEGGGYILFGRTFGTEVEITTMGPSDGVRQFGPAVSVFNAENLGDINKDGRPDLGFASTSDTIEGLDAISVLYGPEFPTSDGLVGGEDLIPGTGYLIEPNLPGFLGRTMENIGDFNNDGTPDLITTAPRTPVDGVQGFGGAPRIVFGQDEQPEGPVVLGESPETGVALLGQDENITVSSQSFSSVGDFDADGLTDFALGAAEADPNGLSNAGSVYVVPGKAVINQVKTGNANGVDNDSAVLNAGLSTNNRETEVHFEYGSTAEYGQSTSTQEFEASNNGDAASIEVAGLQPNTTYHYRAVAKNALGLVRYGDDKTLTTTNTPGGNGGSNCDTDNTLPGCAGYDHCKVKPADCQGSNNRAKLAKLIATPKSLKVKRGKRGSVSVIVVNAGGQSASGVKVCVKAPKKLVKVKRCQSIGALGSGATKSKAFKVTIKKKAKRGKKLNLKFTASATGLDSRKASATVKVK